MKPANFKNTGRPIELGELKYTQDPYDYGVLKDAVWHPYPADHPNNRSGDNGEIRGTVVRGYTVSRLLQYRSNKAWEAGESKTFGYCTLREFFRNSDGGLVFIGRVSV